MFSKHLFLPLALILLLTGCDHRLPLSPQTSSSLLSTSAASVARTDWTGGAAHVEGEVGPGALYRLDVPEHWNGDLVIYVHGYTEESGAPVALPAIDYLRGPLLARGFALATSSFSSNGYALKEGFTQSHQLRGLFTSKFAVPRRTLVVGQSLGGIIALKLAETYPEQYDGAMFGCGVIGGTRSEITFV